MAANALSSRNADSISSMNGQQSLPLVESRSHKRDRVLAERWLINNMIEAEALNAAGHIHCVQGKLTPALASLLLSDNPDNRNLREGHINALASDMASGRWKLNGEAIKISLGGKLNDGQHRCHGVVRSNCAIETIFVFGLDRGSRFSLDQGMTRTAGGNLTMQLVPNGPSHAATAGILLRHRQNRAIKSDGSSFGITKAAIQEYVIKNIDMLQWGYALVSAPTIAFKTLASRSLLVAAAIMLREASKDVPAVEQFFYGLVHGENINREHPIYVLRQKLMKIQGSETTQARLESIIRTWNAIRTRAPLNRISCIGKLPDIEA